MADNSSSSLKQFMSIKSKSISFKASFGVQYAIRSECKALLILRISIVFRDCTEHSARQAMLRLTILGAVQ